MAKNLKPELHIEEARGAFERRSFRHLIRSGLSRGTSVWPSLSSPAMQQLHSILQIINPGRLTKRDGLTSYPLGLCDEGKALMLIVRFGCLNDENT